jgi:hypothetical protein
MPKAHHHAKLGKSKMSLNITKSPWEIEQNPESEKGGTRPQSKK